jgi:glucose/arabinose dehydrogenase
MKKNSYTQANGLVKKFPINRWLFTFFTFIIACLLLFQSCKKPDFDVSKSSANNQSSAISGSYDLKLVAGNFVSPLTVMQPNDGTKRLFVIDQIGKVWIIFPDGSRSTTPFLNVTDKMVSLMPGYDERGLLGFAFHPDFKHNGKFYVYYSAPPRMGGAIEWDNLSVISEFKVSSNPNKADMSSEKRILEVNHPQFNHNGGTLAFGPDNYLYISIGDGGGADDTGPGHVGDWYKPNTGGNGQDVTHNLMGNILRIDVNTTSGDKAYGIPQGNPFVGKTGKNEIYAYGFRNPYRFSFDMAGQHWLYAGDAGQALYEEIDVVQKGGNYGWNVKEGTHCFNATDDTKERKACPVQDSAGNPLLDPVIEVKNAANPDGNGETIAIVGGYVYRGHSLPFLYGKYIFGFLSADGSVAKGKILVAKPSTIGLWSYEVLKLKSFQYNLGQWLKGFGQDQSGEIYVTTSKEIGPQGSTGKIYKLVFAQ